jgi:hypothetical protein
MHGRGCARALRRMNELAKLEQTTHVHCSSSLGVVLQDVDLIQSACITVWEYTPGQRCQHSPTRKWSTGERQPARRLANSLGAPTNSRMPQLADGTLCRSLSTDFACLMEMRTESHQFVGNIPCLQEEPVSGIDLARLESAHPLLPPLRCEVGSGGCITGVRLGRSSGYTY